MRFRTWLAYLILGRPKSMEQEIQEVYKDIWPKHRAYKDDTLNSLRSAYLKWTSRMDAVSSDEQQD